VHEIKCNIQKQSLFIIMGVSISACCEMTDLTKRKKCLLSLLLSQEVSELVVRSLGEGGLSPELRRKETVAVTDGSEGSLDEVTKGTGGTTGSGVAIGDTSEGKDLLGSGGSDDTSTTGSRDQARDGRTTLASELAGNGVRLTKGRSPVTTTDRDDRKLGKDDSTTDGSGDFLRALDTETNVAVAVTNDNEGLESGTLTSTGLLLDRGDLHNLILKLGKEVVNDLVFLDGKREEVDLLNGLDLAILDKTTELSNGDPLVLLLLASTTAATTATTTTTTTSTPSSTTSRRCAVFGLRFGLG